MSNSGKSTRASRAFAGARDLSAEHPKAELDAHAPPAVSGAWSAHAARGLSARLVEVEEEARRANELQYEGILEGTVPVRIPVSMIEDVVGTDRILNLEDSSDEDSFRSLVKNIQQRGQRTPIRVRPLNAEWRPHPVTPRDVGAQRFALQSGRRRLAACRELGLDPLCFLSFAEPDFARLEDLQERFYENAVRRELSQIERLYSIGLIARETQGASQGQIAEIIGVSRPAVNRGMGVVEHFDELKERIDLSSATRDEIDQALKEIRANHRELSSSPDAIRMREHRGRRTAPEVPALPFRRRETSRGTLSLTRSRSGSMVLKIESEKLDDELLAKLMQIMETG